MALNVDIWNERDNWRGPLARSIVLHVSVVAAIIVYGMVLGARRGSDWGAGGGGEGAIGVSLVSSIPLPANPNATNIVATESKGLSKTEPKVEEKTPDAIPIPERNAKRKPWEKAPRTVDKRYEKPVETATNVIPYGEGGPLAGPYSVFSAGAAKGGFGFSGGGGDFGSRYAWYVRVVQQKVSENWLKYEIDPRITQARRVYVTFDILRSGQPSNIQIEQSSGVPSLDQSAVRALHRIDTFGPLPSDYSGSKVSVEFWFDFKR
ncbi:MAG: energy transducer TonB [Terriglobales bacterium]